MFLNESTVKKKFFRYSTITVVVLSSLIIVAYAYSLLYHNKDGNAYLTPIPLETAYAHHVNYPIDNKLDAVIAALKLLGTSRLRSKEIPNVIYIEHLRYRKVKDKTIPNSALSLDMYPANKKVWIVVFEGQWHIEGGPEPGPTHTLVSHSQSFDLPTPTISPNRCIYVLFGGSKSDEGSSVGGIFDCEILKE